MTHNDAAVEALAEWMYDDDHSSDTLWYDIPECSMKARYRKIAGEALVDVRTIIEAEFAVKMRDRFATPWRAREPDLPAYNRGKVDGLEYAANILAKEARDRGADV